MQLQITTDCTYFHKGYERRDYVAGETVETDDEEFVAVAIDQGWASANGETVETDATDKPAKKTARTR